jgi:hypothetical protein
MLLSTHMYSSTWAASAVLCQIINLIQNFWFGTDLFNSENFSLCVIYSIKFPGAFKMFRCVNGQKDVKYLIWSGRSLVHK